MENNSEYLLLTLKYALREKVVKIELFVFIILVIAVVYVAVFSLRPLDTQYQSQQSKSYDLEHKIEEKMRQKALAVEYNKAFPIIDVIEEKLSTKFSQAELTRKFDALAKTQGVEVVSMNTKNAELDSGYRSYINEIKIRGQYTAIKKLLVSLNELPGFNNVVELKLTKEVEAAQISGVIILVTVRAAS